MPIKDILRPGVKYISIGIIFFMIMQSTIQVNSQFTSDISDMGSSDVEIYSSMPDWVSENPHYSTGAELADINQDGWLDLVVADGNDMAKGHLNVYLNDHGSFPVVSNWQSEDITYNGHLDIADVNGDGWPDVAVSCLGTGSSFGPIARLYLNNNGVLSSLPDWNADVSGNAFGVDFGDMNNDGRPDLAIATGWSYSPNHPYHNYVYLNMDGMLSSSPSWISDDRNYYQGVLWVDADNDGWLDLVGTGTGDQIYMYQNQQGMLETTASWNTSEDFHQDGIMLTAGDVTGDGVIDLFATDNTQLRGSGLFRQYDGIQDGYFETDHSWNYYGGYGSAVALADINGDNHLDLATGGWWNPTLLFYNQGSGLSDTPQWYSEISSVIEKILFGDIGPTLEKQKLMKKTYSNNEYKQLFYLPHQSIQYIQKISCDGIILSGDEYTYSREHGWFSISKEEINTIDVEYYYSKSLDMIYSNWDPGKGNFLYYNHNVFADLYCSGTLVWSDVEPGEQIQGTIQIENRGDNSSLLDWEIIEWPTWGEWTFSTMDGDDLTPEQGAIFIDITINAPHEKNQEYRGELIITNKKDPTDYEVIPTSLTTAKKKTLFHHDFVDGHLKIMNQFRIIEKIIQWMTRQYE